MTWHIYLHDLIGVFSTSTENVIVLFVNDLFRLSALKATAAVIVKLSDSLLLSSHSGATNNIYLYTKVRKNKISKIQYIKWQHLLFNWRFKDLGAMSRRTKIKIIVNFSLTTDNS